MRIVCQNHPADMTENLLTGTLSINILKQTKFISLLLIQNMLWVLKRTVSVRRFFDQPKQMFKLMV